MVHSNSLTSETPIPFHLVIEQVTKTTAENYDALVLGSPSMKNSPMVLKKTSLLINNAKKALDKTQENYGPCSFRKFSKTNPGSH